MSIQQIGALVVEGVLGLLTVFTAYTLFARKPKAIQDARDALRYPRWYWVLAGFLAAIGAIGLLVGLIYPIVGVLAVLWMIAYFIVATLTHLVRFDFRNFATPLFFGLFFVGLMALRWGDAGPILAYIGM